MILQFLTAQCFAQGFDARAPGGGGGIDGVTRVERLAEAPSAGFVVETATDLLVRQLSDGDDLVEVPMLDALVGAELFAAASLSTRVGFAASAPVWLTSSGRSPGGVASGDVQLSLPITLSESERGALHAVPVGALPTGSSARYLGEGGPVAGALLSATIRGGATSLRVDAGPDWMPPTGLPDWPGGLHGRVAAVAGWAATRDLELVVGARGRAPLGRPIPSVPSEATLVGRVCPREHWWLIVGGGTALTRGPGASPLRMVVGLERALATKG